ncbi:MAG TPA: hypothetical protein ENK29_05030 [Chromatiales bacterium]|nr:hypothetical protein [Chromatiales bacterium]
MQKLADEMRELGRKQATMMRDKARERAMRRKEEYLGARVPRELKEAVIAHASKLGIPVSILIRNILEEAFQVKEGAGKHDGTAGANDAGGEPQFPQVIGWEEIRLNRAMTCAACGREAARGSMVMLGLAGPGEDHVILCGKCKY